jgi:flagellar hook assembly protein FlgD
MQAGLKNSKFVGQWNDGTVGVGDLPFTLALDAPVPSPTRGASTFSFRLSQASQVRLDLIDVRGRLVTTLFRGYLTAGLHEARWNGRDVAGGAAPSGIYFARLSDGHAERFQRLVRLGD